MMNYEDNNFLSIKKYKLKNPIKKYGNNLFLMKKIYYYTALDICISPKFFIL